MVKEGVDTVDDCKDVCIDDPACVQYMFDASQQECKIAHDAAFGEASQGSGLFSEWIFDRIEQWRDEQPPCEDEFFLDDVVDD